MRPGLRDRVIAEGWHVAANFNISVHFVSDENEPPFPCPPEETRQWVDLHIAYSLEVISGEGRLEVHLRPEDLERYFEQRRRMK